ncbi:hypothetical protein [Halobaculum lipolyticum]|uniref:Uncharacterized protein n=1 Tax=Halobaculum lipolyticum TaxID=3032001 RepID=A0ABD5W7K0_9EURY|nr:hypothetical protein [Halobaculum sp. DT31]
MTDGDESTADGDTVADVDHEAPEGAVDPNAVWERGEEPPAAETDGDDDRP